MSLHNFVPVFVVFLLNIIIGLQPPKPPFLGEGKPPFLGQGKPPFLEEGKPPFLGEGKPPFLGEGKPPFLGEEKGVALAPFPHGGPGPSHFFSQARWFSGITICIFESGFDFFVYIL